jgi:hypothetical protein
MLVKMGVEAVENLIQKQESSLIDLLQKEADRLFFWFRIAERYNL